MILGNLFKKQYPGATVQFNYPVAHNPMKGKKLHEEGYKYNVVVFRCVDSIIKALKGVEIKIKQGDEYLEDDKGPVKDIHKLLTKPNPKQYKGAFLTEAFVNWLILGEMFLVTAEDFDSVPRELWNLDPLEMHVLPGKGLPKAYEQKVQGSTVRWDVNPIDGASQVFFWKGHNPTNKWRGMSPLHAASLAADTHNAGLKWNFSLLKKGARPSGIIKYKGVPAEDVLDRVRKYFKGTMQGENNAGEVPILTGEADFQELGKTPKEMDHIKGIDSTTAFIAMAYGVPLPLVLNNAATFNNYREAKEQFYTDTVLPLFGEFLESFGGWILPRFGLDDAQLCYDEDSIPALETIRERRNERMTKLVDKGIISPDEAREELGYTPRGGIADELFMPSSAIPMGESSLTDVDNISDSDLKELLLKSGYTEQEVKDFMHEERD
jgi:HK97 family phage portal protein